MEMKQYRWPAAKCAVFCRSRDQYGNLSNMTRAFPLTVNGTGFQGPEGLYQALKFPDSTALQVEIGAERSGMEAKRTAYAHRGFRPDWDDIKMKAMAFTLATKLAQHPETFATALKESGQKPIVERSTRDAWWGAKPQGAELVGANVLGRLLTKLRNVLNEEQGDAVRAAEKFLEGVDLSDLTIRGKPVTLEHKTKRPTGVR